jgi:hypothetical protein
MTSPELVRTPTMTLAHPMHPPRIALEAARSPIAGDTVAHPPRRAVLLGVAAAAIGGLATAAPAAADDPILPLIQKFLEVHADYLAADEAWGDLVEALGDDEPRDRARVLLYRYWCPMGLPAKLGAEPADNDGYVPVYAYSHEGIDTHFDDAQPAGEGPIGKNLRAKAHADFDADAASVEKALESTGLAVVCARAKQAMELAKVARMQVCSTAPTTVAGAAALAEFIRVHVIEDDWKEECLETAISTLSRSLGARAES